MEYIITDHFKKHIKPLLKKFRFLLDDVIHELKRFNHRNAISLGSKLYKVRVKSSDLRKGKSHGFRLIIVVVSTDELISPVVLYFKSDRSDISFDEIQYHLAMIEREIDQ